MALAPVPVSDFGGLDLISSPDQSACIDLLNVDFDRLGSVRSRDGYTTFSTATSGQQQAACPFYNGSTRQLIVWDNGVDLRALDDSGTSIATDTTPAFSGVSFARLGTPSAARLYIAGAGGDAITRWDGSAFTALSAVDARPAHIAVQSPDNRLVAAYQTATSGSFTTSGSRVYFSDAGDPETFDSTNFVDLTPGDGESITGACAWRELVFIFKQSKFFVFYGNSTDATGGAVFNYRVVDIGSSAWPSSLTAPVASQEGVYFCTKRGIYLTTGGPPVLISRALDPLFDGTAAATFQGTAMLYPESMAIVDSDLFVAYAPASGTTNYRLLKYCSTTGAWSYWQLAHPARWITSFKDSTLGAEQLVTIDAASGGDIRRFSISATDDAGTAITSRYRTGFSDLGQPGREKDIDSTRLWGTGTIAVAGSRDFGSLDSASNVTLGTSPAIDAGLHNKQKKGELISYEFASVSGGAWALHRYAHMLRGSRAAGLR